jgi:flagellar biosynthesis/type III secretory pathway M-ring protein FliF/YscJ
MDFFEGDFFELPGALFRKFITARNKSFDKLLRDHTKNKLIGVCVIIFLLVAVVVIISSYRLNSGFLF